jgi:hypothetical protein
VILVVERVHWPLEAVVPPGLHLAFLSKSFNGSLLLCYVVALDVVEYLGRQNEEAAADP